MPKNYDNIPINEMRRKDRATDDQFIKDFLHKAAYCTIAHIDGDQPFQHSNIFYFDKPGNSIYFHTASEGRFKHNIENNQKVCFTVAEMGRLLPADVALEFSVEYTGVIVFGHVQIIKDKIEAKTALQKLLDKYFPHLKPDKDYRSTTDEELKRTTVYQLQIDQWSGKRKKVEDDFEGAFYYGDFK